MTRSSLRPYQEEFVSSVRRDLGELDRVLGVAATGAGKTIMASELMRGWRNGKCLFLADAQELVRQNADKYWRHSGEFAGVEMADESAALSDRVVIGTTQTMARRLDKWPNRHFGLVIVDEAHRNAIGDMAAGVLDHFGAAKVLGLTATPFRSDRKQLGDYFQKISCEIGLIRLIKEGWLSRITIKSVPVNIDMTSVRTTAGDYNAGDLGEAVAPHLEAAADLMAEHAQGRKSVVFLPLIETSKKFRDACLSRGMRAVHVDGKDREALADYRAGRADVVCNASLLTTGWDDPRTDCVFILRPTKSLGLYCQMVGRGTRIHPDKDDLLLLDPLYLTDRHSLITPARLMASTPEEAEDLDAILREEGGDLIESAEQAEIDRASRLAEELANKRARQRRTVDAVEFCLSLRSAAAATYTPEMEWERKPLTDRQKITLEQAGFDVGSITCRGHASKIIDLLFARRKNGMATPKQLRVLRQMGHPSPETATFDEASSWLDMRLGGRRAG